ncbi:hypothetical protein [Leisingera aquaemixtae]|uniref:hypothetical protein n=1 Tax=Leisingera aquaemixtae TaxID=1396826 RepID=UPI0021A560B1|nr:hypothetical protein [Leisingera aquaemixtae]
MAIQIDNFYKQWLATDENRPLCQVIFVEEPEVHLHAQVPERIGYDRRHRSIWEYL